MGVAGLSVAIFVLLSFGISWISGDKERGALEEQVKDTQTAQLEIEKQLNDAKVKSASDVQQIHELQQQLEAEIAEKRRLERTLAIEERQNKMAGTEGVDTGSEGGAAGSKDGVDRTESGNIDQKTLDELGATNKQDIATLEAKLKATEEARKQAEQYETLYKNLKEKGAGAGVASLDELQRKNMELEEKLKESEQTRTSLETKLSNYDKAFNLARASLRNDKPVLDDEKLNAKLKDMQLAMENARLSGLITDAPATASLAASVKETALFLEQARARRAEAEALLNKNVDTDTAQLIKQLSLMYADAKREKEGALMTIGLLQATAKERSKGQVSSLESRLMSLEQNRKGLEGQLNDAMSALVSLDETAARLEADLQSGAQPMEGMLKLQAEIETLRQAREKVRLAMENVKGSMVSNMDSETLRMKGEINQLSGSLEQIALINKTGGSANLMGQMGLEEETIGVKGDDTLILNKKLQGLNLAIDDVFKEGAAQTTQAASGTQTAPCGEVSEDKQLAESYVIQEGDSLWNIAAKKKIYGNPYLWPLLYKYNLKTVYNPDIIYPDFTLKIQRNLDKPEMSFATRKAKKHTKDKRKTGYIQRLRNELTSGIEQR